MKDTKHHKDHVQRNLLRILAVTATHWNVGYRKRTSRRFCRHFAGTSK